jgi:hypothetical protein
MNFSLRILPWFLLPFAAAFAGTKREEVVPLTESRRLFVAVPEGFTYSAKTDEIGAINLQLAAPGDAVTVHVLLLPDPEEKLKGARARKEKMVELFQEFVEGSVEKAMQFEELSPRAGAGTYCVFTDAKLVDKTELPAGEYHHLTSGLKACSGVVAVFRIFSNDTKSTEYLAAMKLLRDSLNEKVGPLR